MLTEFLAPFAFLGNFHPVVVHFPVALLPTVAFFKIVDHYRPINGMRQAIDVMLLISLLSTILAVMLGFTARSANGLNGELVEGHMWLAVATLLMLFVCTALHLQGERLLVWVSGYSNALQALGRGFKRFMLAALRVVKWCLMIVLFPLTLLYWLLRAVYRRLMKERMRPAVARVGGYLRTALRELRVRIKALFGLASAQRLTFVVSLMLVLLTGLKGANVSHGEGHLTRNMPPALAAIAGVASVNEANLQLDEGYYEQALLPVFRRSCIKCHGEDKQRAGLRLDNYADLVASGVVQWQNPYGSELVKRLLLPREDEAAMPPLSKGRELQVDDLTTIVSWIQGHSLETLASKAGGLPEKLRNIAARLPPVEGELIDALNQLEGVRVVRLVENYDLISVNLAFADDPAIASAIPLLQEHLDNIIDLDMSGRRLDSRHRQMIAGMKYLQRLNLSRSSIQNSDLAALAGLSQLEWLNLVGTTVTFDQEQVTTLLPSLQTVYLPIEREPGSEIREKAALQTGTQGNNPEI